jgi:hypothetical protein
MLLIWFMRKSSVDCSALPCCLVMNADQVLPLRGGVVTQVPSLAVFECECTVATELQSILAPFCCSIVARVGLSFGTLLWPPLWHWR